MLSLHKQVWERNEHIFTPNTFDTRRNLAFLYRKTGEIEKALKFLEENFIDGQHIFEVDSPHVVIARDDLARAYESAGRLHEARFPYENAE